MTDLAARKRDLLRRRLQAAGLASESERIPRRARQRAPLSFAQARMWFLQQLDPDSPAYNVCLAIRLSGPLAVDKLRTAFRKLTDRHELLRTRYLSEVDSLVQIVDPIWDGDLEWADELDERAEAAKPFDLARDHPIRVKVTKRGDDHLLVLTVHHIAWDGGTFNALSRDLTALYQGRDLEPLPVQYGDYAAWQREKWTDEHLSEHFDYWQRVLTPAPDPLPIPTDEPRRATPSDRGGRRHHTFEPETTERILAFARKSGATPYMVLLAGFAAVLSRYTGAIDIPIGSATMNRDLADVERLIGNFGNTLVLRTDLSGNPGFGELVERVRKLTAEGFTHQDMPFDRLVERLRPDRQQGRSVFFDVMLLFLTQGLQGPELPDVTAEWETVHNDTTQFDLALEAFLTNGRLLVEATYRAELFHDETIERFLTHLEALLAGAMSEPERPIGTVELLTEDERDLILRQWNDTAAPMTDATLLQLVEEQAARTPAAVAVEFGEESLTYVELNARANQLARRLVSSGVGPERTVGIHLERSLEMVVGILAVLKAGGAFVPVEPSWPQARVEQVKASARVVTLITPEDFEDLDGDTGNLDVPVHPENLAYVIYTSGSTGVPKGAMIRHRAIAHRLLWQRELLGFGGQEDAALFKAPLGFDISINEIFLPLTTGGRLVIAEPGGERDTEYLADVISRHRVTFVYLVSSMLDLLLQLDDFRQRCGSLRHMWCGGEVLTPELFERFRAASQAVMYHGYGPAEATIGVSHVVYRTGSIRSVVSIGRPNTNTRLYVLDGRLRPVPVGVPGELYAAGVYLGRGYVNDPRRTADHFVADPFGPPGSRLYRTGDLARWRPDGTLEFLGRADNQVKIRGMRVELEEIEAVLEQHELVRRAVVVVREDAPGVKRLAGYCLPAGDGDVERIAAWARARLPEHMVPQSFMVLPEFPLLPSGKVDRGSLPAPRPESSAASREPSNEREKVLCGLIADLLGLPSVGVDDDFFRLGGDSILSVQLVSRARRAGLALTPRQVFENPAPSALAAVAPVRAQEDVALGEVELTPVMRWAGTSGGINQSGVLVTPDDLTWEDLLRRVRYLLNRHDMLRARLEGDRLVVPAADVTGNSHDVNVELVRREGGTRATGTGDSHDGNGGLAAAAVAARARLDPAAGRMIEFVWFPDARRLLVVAHHLVVDWVSWPILMADLADPGREPSGTSFRRWTRILAEEARSPRRVAELDRWRELLTGAPRLVGNLRPERDLTSTLRRTELVLPPELTEPLVSTLPAAYYATAQDVLLAGLAMATESPVVIGLEGHGREEQIADGIDLSSTVGWFTSFYPVLLDAGGPDRPGTVLKRVKERVRAMPDHGLGYGLLRHLNPETAPVLGELPEPGIVFNYLGRVPPADGLPWEIAPEAREFRLPPEDDRPVVAALDIEASLVDQRLRLTVSWPDKAVASEFVEDLITGWERALRVLAEHAADPDAGGHTPSDLTLALSQEELDEIESGGDW